MNRFLRGLLRFHQGKKGFTLIETLISLAILGVTAVTFLTGLTTASSIVLSEDERETTKNLAESQMEYVKNQAYATSYDPAPVPAGYPDYSVNISVNTLPLRDGNIQKVAVNVSYYDKKVFSLEGYKVN